MYRCTVNVQCVIHVLCFHVCVSIQMLWCSCMHVCSGSEEHESQPQARKTQLKTSLLFKHGRNPSKNTQSICFFFSHSTTRTKTLLNLLDLLDQSHRCHPRILTHHAKTATCVYLAMWLKPRYIQWRQLTFHTFISLSSHQYCLRCCGTQGAEITHYKSSNHSLGLCLLHLSFTDKINKHYFVFAICFYKQLCVMNSYRLK